MEEGKEGYTCMPMLMTLMIDQYLHTYIHSNVTFNWSWKNPKQKDFNLKRPMFYWPSLSYDIAVYSYLLPGRGVLDSEF